MDLPKKAQKIADITKTIVIFVILRIETLKIAIFALMSICNDCQKVDSIPTCTDAIVVGTISSADTNVYVYFTDTSNGRVVRYDELSDSNGLVTVDLSNDRSKLMEGRDYNVHITLASATSWEEKENITIGGTAYDCVRFRAEQINDGDADTPEQYTSVTFTV